MLRGVRDEVMGRLFRMARFRRGWTQKELSDRTGLSESTTSRIEGGQAGRYRLHVVQKHGDSLGLRVEIQVTGRGGEAARLLDEEHAAIVEHVAAILGGDGWLVDVEPSYSIYGERGRMDLLAFHLVTGTLLVVEVKTEITDLQALFGSLSVKERLAPKLAAERGWDVRRVATLLAVADTHANRSSVGAHGTLFGRFERHAGRVRAWIHRPDAEHRSLLLAVPASAASRPRWLATRRRVRHGGHPDQKRDLEAERDGST